MAHTIGLIKHTIKSAIKNAGWEKLSLSKEDPIGVEIYDEHVTVVLPVVRDGYYKPTRCDKSDSDINHYLQYQDKVIEKNIIIHHQSLGYDLKQIKRLVMVLDKTIDECVEHYA